MAEAKRDNNQVTTLLAVSNADGVTPVVLYADPTTHRLLVSASAGSLDDLSDVVITGGAQGDILYNNGTNWVNLGPGTTGKYLKTQGAGANPMWDTPTAGAAGSDTQVQFNDGGAVLGGDAGLVYNKTSDTLSVDHIAEVTAAHGVAVDGITLKDGGALVITGGTNTFNLTNGTSVLDIAAASTLNVDANLTVETASIVNQDLTTDANVQFATATLNNTGLHLLDTNASHDLIIVPGSDLSADRNLTITTGDAARTLSIEADSTVNQDLTTDANVQFATATLNNTGLHLLDTNASHDLIIAPGSDLTADKTLTVTTGDADRTMTLSGNLTVESASLINQDLTSDADATFGSVTVGNSGLHVLDTNASHDLIITPGSDLSADRILTITTGDAARTISLSANLTLPADPGADKILFWDDSETATAYLGVGNSIAITATTIDTIQDIRTSANPQFATLELGAATDTTISRSAAGVIAVEGVVLPSISSTNTLTNKRLTARITTITSDANPTVNTDNCDAVTITAQAAAIASMTTNLSGTPTNFQKLIVRIKDDGTARAITWGASFEAKGVALPTTTVISKVLTVGFLYDTVTSKWGCVASAQEA